VTTRLGRLQEESFGRAEQAVLGSWPRERAMDARTLADFLRAKDYCVLATGRPDGRPQARPVAFTVVDDSFWIATVAGRRLTNLRRIPYASLVVMEGERTEHRMVLAEGAVELHDAMPEHVESAWRAKHGWHPTWAAAFAELRPDRLFSYEARS
jgi:nitroimidazol reductase NimA-like FMN-containing flavoprotein (pyridoxamine 5'-phosphate oxidase superfamily)